MENDKKRSLLNETCSRENVFKKIVALGLNNCHLQPSVKELFGRGSQKCKTTSLTIVFANSKKSYDKTPHLAPDT